MRFFWTDKALREENEALTARIELLSEQNQALNIKNEELRGRNEALLKLNQQEDHRYEHMRDLFSSLMAGTRQVNDASAKLNTYIQAIVGPGFGGF